MWFGYKEETTWHHIPVKRVVEILEMNKDGKVPATLETDMETNNAEEVATLLREKEELSRFDDKFKKKKKKKKKKPTGNGPVTNTGSSAPVERVSVKPERVSPPSEKQQHPNNPNKPAGQERPHGEHNPRQGAPQSGQGAQQGQGGQGGQNRNHRFKNRKGPRPNNNNNPKQGGGENA